MDRGTKLSSGKIFRIFLTKIILAQLCALCALYLEVMFEKKFLKYSKIILV